MNNELKNPKIGFQYKKDSNDLDKACVKNRPNRTASTAGMGSTVWYPAHFPKI